MIGDYNWLKVKKAIVRAANGGKVYEFTDCETTSDDITITFHNVNSSGEDIYSVLINANIESIIMTGVSEATAEDEITDVLQEVLNE